MTTKRPGPSVNREHLTSGQLTSALTPPGVAPQDAVSSARSGRTLRGRSS
jgi:hypothetical protein